MYTLKQKIERKPGLIEVKPAIREGQSLEEFLRKAMKGNEPIQATAKITYNDRKDGVLPQHDIRTDRFAMALAETDKVHATKAAARKSQDFPEPPQEPAQAIVQAAQQGAAPTGEA